MNAALIPAYQIRRIRTLFAEGDRFVRDLAATFRLSKAIVREILRGNLLPEAGGPTWPDLPDRWHNRYKQNFAAVERWRAEYEAGGISVDALAAREGIHRDAMLRYLRGVTRSRRPIPAETVEQIRAEYAAGVSPTELAEKYGAGLRTVTHYVRDVPSPFRRVDESLVRELRERYAADIALTYVALAREYGIHKDAVRNAVTGRAWPHAGGPITPPGRLARVKAARKQQAELDRAAEHLQAAGSLVPAFLALGPSPMPEQVLRLVHLAGRPDATLADILPPLDLRPRLRPETVEFIANNF